MNLNETVQLLLCENYGKSQFIHITSNLAMELKNVARTLWNNIVCNIKRGKEFFFHFFIWMSITYSVEKKPKTRNLDDKLILRQ